MPAKKKVTAELLEELIAKAKRVKRFQAGRLIKGERSDGQPTYHYPKITLTLLANKLDVTSNYLTILRKKDPKIEKVLRHVGQPKGQLDEIHGEDPKEGTKAHKDLQIKRLKAELEKLKTKARQNRKRNIALKLAEQQVEKLITNSEELVMRNDEQKRKIIELGAMLKGLRMENASLKMQLALCDKKD